MTLEEMFSYCPETGDITWRIKRPNIRVGQKVGHLSCGYVSTQFTIGGVRTKVQGHRLAWRLHYGEFPPNGIQIDHINGNRSDNRISNLRLATAQQNRMNERQRQPKPKGVTLFRLRGWERWRARIKKDGKEVSLGYYKTQSEAKAAYDKAAVAMFGEFARLA